LQAPRSWQKLRNGVGILGVGLGLWCLYRPLTVSIDIRYAVVDGSAANDILSTRAPIEIEGSTYVCVILDDVRLKGLLWRKGQPISAERDGHSPHTHGLFGDCSYVSDIVTIEPNRAVPVLEPEEIEGRFSARGTLSQRQLQVDCAISHIHTDPRLIMIGQSNPDLVTKGRLFYEGPLPSGHLVFIGPINEDLCHVVIFDVQ
jgi:hypothetical protein